MVQVIVPSMRLSDRMNNETSRAAKLISCLAALLSMTSLTLDCKAQSAVASGFGIEMRLGASFGGSTGPVTLENANAPHSSIESIRPAKRRYAGNYPDFDNIAAGKFAWALDRSGSAV